MWRLASIILCERLVFFYFLPNNWTQIKMRVKQREKESKSNFWWKNGYAELWTCSMLCLRFDIRLFRKILFHFLLCTFFCALFFSTIHFCISFYYYYFFTVSLAGRLFLNLCTTRLKSTNESEKKVRFPRRFTSNRMTNRKHNEFGFRRNAYILIPFCSRKCGRLARS